MTRTRAGTKPHKVAYPEYTGRLAYPVKMKLRSTLRIDQVAYNPPQPVRKLQTLPLRDAKNRIVGSVDVQSGTLYDASGNPSEQYITTRTGKLIKSKKYTELREAHIRLASQDDVG